MYVEVLYIEAQFNDSSILDDQYRLAILDLANQM